MGDWPGSRGEEIIFHSSPKIAGKQSLKKVEIAFCDFEFYGLLGIRILNSQIPA
jgi:hypothetical protein